MVQASKKRELCLHKNQQMESSKEVRGKEISDNEVPDQEMPAKETPIKDSSKKELFQKGKPSLHITFHNPNSEEATASFLTKVLAERVAEEMEKGS